jgi:hypothetical protein
MKRILQGPDVVASCYLFSVCLLVLLNTAALRTLVILGVQL